MVSFFSLFLRKKAAAFPACLITNVNRFGLELARIALAALQENYIMILFCDKKTLFLTNYKTDIGR